MGVPGLWQLLEPSKRAVDLEQFRGKRMAVDMNIWMHQALKSRGASKSNNPNFYLSILFRRICKLLFYGIKPIFVFDGAVPELKKATMDTRRRSRREMQVKSDRMRARLVKRIFQRMAEATVMRTSKNPPKDLTGEFLKHINNTEERRRALQDIEMFAPPTDNPIIFDSELSSKAVELEKEQQADAELARDFINSFPIHDEIDFESDAYKSLPLSTQLHVINILKNKITYGHITGRQCVESEAHSQSSPELFSNRQVNRLLHQRELTQRNIDLQSRINTMASLTEVKSRILEGNNSGWGLHLTAMMEGGDCQIQAHRIASQDVGHTILLTRSSSSNVSLTERLQSLIKTTPEKREFKRDSPTKADTSLSDSDETIHRKNVKIQKMEEDAEELSFISVFDQLSPDNESTLSRKTDSLTSEPSSTNKCSQETEIKQQVCLDVPVRNLCLPDMPPQPKFRESPIPTEQEFVTYNSDTIRNNKQVLGNCDAMNFSQPVDHAQSIESDSDVSDAFEEVKSAISPEESEVEDEEADDDDEEEEDFEQISERLSAADNTNEVKENEEDEFEMDDEMLLAEAEKLERQAQQMSSDSISEAQRLLHLFGIPVLWSPEEAEAQCSRLQQLGLVDVVASDDSDVWLFGAGFVCRHLFGGHRSKKKRSEEHQAYTYSLKDIHDRLGLDRTQFLRIALLCGSDYTCGVPKVGPVTALEILAYFAANSPVREENSDSSFSLSSFDNLTIRREARRVLQPLVTFRSTLSEFQSNKTVSPNKSSPVSKWQSLNIPSDFPNELVVEGYLLPKVDSSISEFRWNPPDVPGLIQFATEKLGWPREASKATLQSVISKFKDSCNSPTKQTTYITDYFQQSPVKSTSPKRNSRLDKATMRLKYAAELNNLPDLDADWSDSPETSQSAKSTPTKKRRRGSAVFKGTDSGCSSSSKRPRKTVGSKTKLQFRNMSQ